MKKTIHIPFCKECGCEDIVFDAYAGVNPETGELELHGVYDNAYCPECDYDDITVDGYDKEIEV